MTNKFKIPNKKGMGSLDIVSAMADAIQQMEGYYPGSLAYMNNNPGNLRFANQPGAIQGKGGFAAFPSYNDGLTALKNQIQYQINKGQNLTQFFNQYAPSTENDTNNYISFVAGKVGIDTTTPLNQYQDNNPIDTSTSSPTDIAFTALDANNIVNDASGIVGALTIGDFSTASSILGSDALLAGGITGVGLLILYWIFG